MSDTTAPKKSILTRLAENVAAKKAAKVSTEIDPTSEEARAKQVLKKAGIVLIGTAAAVTAVIVIASKFGNEEETSTDSETTED